MLASNYSGYSLEVGTDEAGRGCLAGPVVAAAVLLPKDFKHPLLNDSKQLSEKQRAALRPIIEQEAISFGVSFIHHEEVDELNVLHASITGMHRAIAALSLEPEYIIVDGNKFKPYQNIPYQTIVKGDGKYMSIAAASVLAKTYRDEFMERIHQEHPQYFWKQNKGYPTQAHRNAIVTHGISPYHRRSFKLLPTQLSLDFTE